MRSSIRALLLKNVLGHTAGLTTPYYLCHPFLNRLHTLRSSDFFDRCFSPSTDDGPKLSSAPSPLHMLLKNRISRIFPSHLHCPLLVFIQGKKKKRGKTAHRTTKLTATSHTKYTMQTDRPTAGWSLQGRHKISIFFPLTPSRGQATVMHRTPKTPLLTEPFFNLEKRLRFPASFCCA